MYVKSRKLLASLIILTFILSNFVLTASPQKNDFTKNGLENLPYKKQIEIPIDTSKEKAKLQPIDTKVEFKNQCWAKDEKQHSIRVAYDDGSGLTEIESQIYNLEHTDETHIESCNIVFLIPKKIKGDEKYYIIYSDSKTEKPDYKNHVDLEDTHYFYEPIPGQKIEFDYYKIKDEKYIPYCIVQKGQLLGNPIAFSVLKMKAESKKVETYNVDQMALFGIRYGINKYPGFHGTPSATNVKKHVLVDGNLMVRVKIEANSPKKAALKTDNIYTYHHCPEKTKRMHVNVQHEVNKRIEIEEPSVLDGTYAGISSIKSRSATIEKMNVGEILPSLNIYSEEESIKEFSIPTDPSSERKEIVLSTQDDVDIGEKAWICLNNKDSSKAHGLILNSNEGLTDESKDGVQVKAYVKQNVKLPGIEGDTGNVYLTRNSYEKGSDHKTVLPEGFKVNYKAEFITFEKEGCKGVDSESVLFQKLIKNVPVLRENVSLKEEKKVERYSLTTFVHLAPSAPMGSLLSAGLGKNISYIYAELYENNSFKSSGTATRLPITGMDINLENKSILEKMKTILGIFDWKNISIFKKIHFPGLEKGKYKVRIYKENPLLANERQYIGFQTVEVNGNTSTHVYCRIQGNMKLSVFDQNEEGIKDVEFVFLRDEDVVATALSNDNGSAFLKAPCFPSDPYTLNVLYNGFLVEEKKVKLRFLNRLFPLEESFSFDLFSLDLSLEDTWGFAPAVDVNPTVISQEMMKPVSISAEKIDNSEYHFYDVYPAEYVLNMNYKSFTKKENVSISRDKSLEFVFPAEYDIVFDMLDSYGQKLNDDVRVKVSRRGKEASYSLENGEGMVSVPPGEYEIAFYSDGEEIAKQRVEVKSDKHVEIVTSVNSFLHSLMFYLGLILAFFSVIFMIWKKRFYTGFKLLAIAFIIMALVSPWWILYGGDSVTSTSTKTFLFPSKMVTLTSSSDVLGGVVSSIPSEVTMAFTLVSLLLVLAGFLSFVTILTKNKEFRRTTISLSVVSMIMIVASIAVFYFVMSMVAEIGIGSFMGSGSIQVDLPGLAESKMIECSWNTAEGFYFAMISLLCLFFFPIYRKIKPYLQRN